MHPNSPKTLDVRADKALDVITDAFRDGLIRGMFEQENPRDRVEFEDVTPAFVSKALAVWPGVKPDPQGPNYLLGDAAQRVAYASGRAWGRGKAHVKPEEILEAARANIEAAR